MIIKVCGLKQKKNLLATDDLGVQMIGLNFYAPSKRYVQSARGEDLGLAQASAKKVGVFVRASLEKILTKVEKFQLDYVQLHGDEEVDFCTKVQLKVPIIKVFRVGEDFSFQETEAFSFADYFLFDTFTTAFGGSGKAFDWSLLNKYQGKVPFLLSGGIGSRDVSAIKALTHPQFVGIDINSKFEVAPGLKDVKMISLFLEKLNEVDKKN